MIVIIFIQCFIKNTCDLCVLQNRLVSVKKYVEHFSHNQEKLDKQKSESLLRNGTLSRSKILVECSAN